MRLVLEDREMLRVTTHLDTSDILCTILLQARILLQSYINYLNSVMANSNVYGSPHHKIS